MMLLIVSILECISALDEWINTWEFSQPLLTDIHDWQALRQMDR